MYSNLQKNKVKEKNILEIFGWIIYIAALCVAIFALDYDGQNAHAKWNIW